MYTIIAPPFTLKFATMSADNLASYYKWFMEVKNERVSNLVKYIHTFDKFKDWSPDFSQESLVDLGRWFYKNVESERKKPFALLRDALFKKNNTQTSNWSLTTRTYSIAFDVGLYVAAVFIKEHPELLWKQNLSTRRDDIDYGQPVLVGFGDLVFNPIHKMVVIANSFVSKSRGPNRLLELFKLWETYIP